MPDWNPAEIIGIKPGYLSISLYQELITDFIWAKNRNSYGFSDMTAFHLMTIFLGTPFIDVRVDFNSWLPKNLSSNLKKKLIIYYLDKLKKILITMIKLSLKFYLHAIMPKLTKNFKV